MKPGDLARLSLVHQSSAMGWETNRDGQLTGRTVCLVNGDYVLLVAPRHPNFWHVLLRGELIEVHIDYLCPCSDGPAAV